MNMSPFILDSVFIQSLVPNYFTVLVNDLILVVVQDIVNHDFTNQSILVFLLNNNIVN